MKIEIDLNDILGDENGAETLQESVRRQVINSLTAMIKSGIGKKLDEEVARVINAELAAAMKDRMPALVDDLMSAEYTPVDRWGSRGKKTTFRDELIKTIQNEMVYKKDGNSYNKNAFTKAVDDAIDEHLSKFKAEFVKQVDGPFIAQAMNHAAASLAKKFGVDLSSPRK